MPPPLNTFETATDPLHAPPPLPPRPHTRVIQDDDETVNEKATPVATRKRWYPATRLGRWIFWTVILLILAIIIAIVATICVLTIGKSSEASPSTASDGGHPLNVTLGGVSIGKPGDIAQYGNNSNDHFVLIAYRSSFVTRLDPIVNPGAVSSHLHRVHGTSYFTPNLIKASDMQTLANCSTTVVQDDKSAYWVASIHYRYPNNTFVSVPVYYTSVYYFQKAPTGVTIHPFPDNYNLVAGNPYRRAYNASDTKQNALWWQCYRGGGNDLVTRGFPPSACKDGLVSVIVFPSCWDGVVADDYANHTAYPVDGVNGYYCPSAFPLKLATLQFETTFAVGKFPWTAGQVNWVMANGDTTGYGIHADFMNGWKGELELQQG